MFNKGDAVQWKMHDVEDGKGIKGEILETFPLTENYVRISTKAGIVDVPENEVVVVKKNKPQPPNVSEAAKLIVSVGKVDRMVFARDTVFDTINWGKTSQGFHFWRKVSIELAKLTQEAKDWEEYLEDEKECQ